jgi:hypothetical protein
LGPMRTRLYRAASGKFPLLPRFGCLFRAIFTMIADKAGDKSTLTHGERTAKGASLAIEDAKHANLHMHQVLYGLIEQLLERVIGKPLASLDQVRIPRSVRAGPRRAESPDVHRHRIAAEGPPMFGGASLRNVAVNAAGFLIARGNFYEMACGN